MGGGEVRGHLSADAEVDRLRSSAQTIIRLLSSVRLQLRRESALQQQIESVFIGAGLPFEREVRLSASDRIDFMVGDVGVEVKVGGSRRAIYEQLVRYAKHESIQALILATGVATVLPREIEGKPVYIANLSVAWL